jgi:hypothetical protein
MFLPGRKSPEKPGDMTKRNLAKRNLRKGDLTTKRPDKKATWQKEALQTGMMSVNRHTLLVDAP